MFKIKYLVDNKLYENNSEFLEVIDNGLKVILKPKTKIELVSVRLYFPKDEGLYYCNGFQSWTDSGLLNKNEKVDRMRFLGKVANHAYNLKTFGDYDFVEQSRLYSHTYTYIQNGENVTLYGSIDEEYGYTTFHFKKEMEVHKDVEGVIIDKEITLFNLVKYNGTLDEVLDKYFMDLNIPKKEVKKLRGYTSWYRHYQNISEDILMKDLDGLLTTNFKSDIFQIDDGFQEYVGDWFRLNKKKFPNGLKPIIDKVKANGMLPGIWLAPFIVEKDSYIMKEHPEWILKKGAKNWSGIYSLNFELEEVKQYIRDTLNFYKEMGFEFFKLDFLYGVAVEPLNGKSRAKIMYEAMDFLREELKDKLILGCGVPMGASFGKVDYCRIGCDVSLKFDDVWFMRLCHRERISTKNAIKNTIARAHLDGRAFGIDPDVFILRKNVMTDNQRMQLFETNKKYGSILFCSDNMGEYDEEERKLVESLNDL